MIDKNPIQDWNNVLQCPDCSCGLIKDQPVCPDCRRVFKCKQGIWNFLPTAIDNLEGKEKEKDGWTSKSDDEQFPPEHYLSLPHHPHPYYQGAAHYLKIILEYGKPWTGTRVLELGAAECWGARHFVEAGALAAALDYDSNRMRKGQILLDHLPIDFLRVNGDAEKLPFEDQSLDRIFACSVLHHFFNLPRAVQEISRTLKKGGIFFGIHEAFHPPHNTQEQILSMTDDTIPNIESGINEQSFTAAHYRNLFHQAGLEFELINPRWDTRWDGHEVKVQPGIGIYNNPDYVSQSIYFRLHRKGLIGKAMHLLQYVRAHRLLANPLIFPLIRFQILNWSVKEKLIVARKV